MKVYTYSKARQSLSRVLDEAVVDGEVSIKRKDGKLFIIKLITQKKSPFDVAPVDVDISRDEIVLAVREGRERF